jgi:hypothetical protein
MDEVKERLEFFSAEFTSAEFKERWGADAIAGFKKDLKNTRYHFSFVRQCLADIRKEHTHYLRTGGKPLEPGDSCCRKRRGTPRRICARGENEPLYCTRNFCWKANMNQPPKKPNPPEPTLREKLEAMSSDKRVQLAILLKMKESLDRNKGLSKQ